VLALAIAAAPAGARASDVRPPPRLERITIDGLVPYHRAEKPITDEQGRIRVIVDLMEEAKDRYLDAARPAIERFDPKRDRHHPQVLLLLDAFGRRHGIEPEYRENERGERERRNITSWVGASVTAYLTEAQIEAIRRDPDVRLVTEDQLSAYASHAVWADSNVGGETVSWGWHAVNGKSSLPGSQRIVYIVDSGVAHHSDLPTLWRRSVGADASWGFGVGCYAHATHVAGIVGAIGTNGQGSRGVYAGIGMVSITGGGAVPESGCMYNAPGLSSSDIGAALDLIYHDNIRRANWVPYPQIVNLSFNGGDTGFTVAGVAQANQVKIRNLATPALLWGGWRHSGHFVAQSAGNQWINGCDTQSHGASLAYLPSADASAAQPDDGVMVVGGLRANGRPAGGAAGGFQPSSPPGLTAMEPGSNYGPCVDIWAPGDSIIAPWGAFGGYTSGSMTYSNLAWVSGTSMAAPHVAAAAAYFADHLGLTSPSAIEMAIRGAATDIYWWTGLWWQQAIDPAGVMVRMVRLP
jgi:hypothetical protein